MKAGVTIKAYPTVERGGMVWTYLGPPDERPPEPDYEWTRVPATHRSVSKSYQACNYLQGLEGGLDTAHVTFLHNNKIGDRRNLYSRDGAPKIDVFETDYGYHYVSTRKVEADQSWVRVYQYAMPFQQMRPSMVQNGLSSNRGVPRADGHIWVPIDDQQTNVYNWAYGADESCALDPDYIEQIERMYGRGPDDYIPGTFKLKANLSNDYFIDRAAQKNTSFTGIKGINTQDVALQEGMGPITDRAREHLGTSDRAIVVMRRLLLDAVGAVARGERPRGSDAATYRNIRPHDGLVPAGSDWREAFVQDLQAKW
jgi:phthalate 4,5-dioxygenase